jgi:hypothetical protein
MALANNPQWLQLHRLRLRVVLSEQVHFANWLEVD